MEFNDSDKRMLAALGHALSSMAGVAPEEEQESSLPDFVDDLIDDVHDGKYDPYLEIMLTTLHSRKRKLRGTRGF